MPGFIHKYRKGIAFGLPLFVLLVLYFAGNKVLAQTYANSSHGDPTDGVNRNSMTGYATGNCAHCHEQHASVGGDEPAPNTPSTTAEGPGIYLGFDIILQVHAGHWRYLCSHP